MYLHHLFGIIKSYQSNEIAIWDDNAVVTMAPKKYLNVYLLGKIQGNIEFHTTFRRLSVSYFEKFRNWVFPNAQMRQICQCLRINSLNVVHNTLHSIELQFRQILGINIIFCIAVSQNSSSSSSSSEDEIIKEFIKAQYIY